LLLRLDDALSLPKKEGVLRLGGEGRPAYYRKVNAPSPSDGLNGQSKVERFKIVFRTPAYFDGGWRPSAEQGGWSAQLGVDAQLIAAAMARPHRIGGWDVAGRNGKGFAKPMYSYVPAGSVYFFESDQPVIPPKGPISQTPAGGSLSLTDLGFGQIVVGTWDWLS
jgi:CRISPR-associated protein Cmr3